jgi:hypothetical protein
MPLLLHRTVGDCIQMDKITESMKGRKSVGHVEENVVAVHHVTLNKPTDSLYQCTWIFDYTDVKRDELEIIASRGLVIKYRNPFKNAPAKELEGLDNQTFMVRQILDESPVRRDPVTKTRNMLLALSKEDREALLKTI